MKQPWTKWYSRDWLSETAIAKTTLAARGLWIEALNVMIASDTFQIEAHRAELARMLRCNESELHDALLNLKSSEAGIVTLHGDGRVTLISRRRMAEIKARNNGRVRSSKHREKHKSNAIVPSVSISDSDSEYSGGGEGGTIGRFAKPTMAEMEWQARKIGLPPTEIDRFFNHYEANGWKVGRVPMKKWRAAMANWRNNYQSGIYANNPRVNSANDGRNKGTYNEGRSGDYSKAAVSGKTKIPEVPDVQRPNS